MRDRVDDIRADIEQQYGRQNTERNARYILSLIEARLKDGKVDDNIPLPSDEAAVKTIILLIERRELPWETICKEPCIRRTMEYLFIRARNHPEEVHEFVSGLLRKHVKGIAPQTVMTFMNIWKDMAYRQRPSSFVEEIQYPEHADRIMETLHFLLRGEVGRGAALVMVCAREEGLVRDIAHSKLKTEFPQVTKTGYNNYLHERFTDKEKNRVVSALRTRIGYTKQPDGRIVFLKDNQTRKNLFIQLWLKFKSYAG
ncbi:MAG: hypothetical protein NC414_02200 [Bacteroidales bacterium]|nr:hypothetical protein [Bacteroidales bacterium]